MTHFWKAEKSSALSCSTWESDPRLFARQPHMWLLDQWVIFFSFLNSQTSARIGWLEYNTCVFFHRWIQVISLEAQPSPHIYRYSYKHTHILKIFNYLQISLLITIPKPFNTTNYLTKNCTLRLNSVAENCVHNNIFLVQHQKETRQVYKQINKM